MKIIHERHAYAPELNKAHIVNDNRVICALPAPGCTTIREARAKLFAPAAPAKVVRGFRASGDPIAARIVIQPCFMTGLVAAARNMGVKLASTRLVG